MGEGRLGTRRHNKDRLCMEFVSPEIWVSSFSMFFDSFPQLAVRYLLNLATVLHRECQVWGLQALSLPPCLYMEAHTLRTHARAGVSSPWACTRLCTGDTRARAAVGSEAEAPVSTPVSISSALFWDRHCCARPIARARPIACAIDRFGHAKPM